MKQQPNQRGNSLIAVLIAMAVILVLVGALLPNLVRLAATNKERGMASAMARENSAELAYQQLYGAYAATTILSTCNLALPVADNNPCLMTGADTAAVQDGYEQNFTGSSQTALANGVQGYLAYTLEADATGLQKNSRSFITNGTSKQIFWATNPESPTVGTNPYPVTLPQGYGNSSSSGTGSTTVGSANPPVPTSTTVAGNYILTISSAPLMDLIGQLDGNICPGGTVAPGQYYLSGPVSLSGTGFLTANSLSDVHGLTMPPPNWGGDASLIMTGVPGLVQGADGNFVLSHPSWFPGYSGAMAYGFGSCSNGGNGGGILNQSGSSGGPVSAFLLTVSLARTGS